MNGLADRLWQFLKAAVVVSEAIYLAVWVWHQLEGPGLMP
jgi:hypothetical protein